MKRMTIRLLMLIPLLLALMALPAYRAAADDETDEIEVKLQATLDGVDCDAKPPTISVLGLTIDISKASLNINVNNAQDGDGAGTVMCADLTVGQVVEVKLASATPDPTTGLLAAVEVDMGGGDCEDDNCDRVKLSAPLQAIDQNAISVTVLGLVVDISQATLEGADDGDNEGDNQPVDVSQLAVGQFVEMELDPIKLPELVATTLEVKNFTNQVDVEVLDEKGNHVDDGDANDVHVDVQAIPNAKTAPKHGKKVLRFHTNSNGSFTLTGLPTGQAKIVVTRVHNGHKTKAASLVKVKGNETKHIRVQLRPVR